MAPLLVMVAIFPAVNSVNHISRSGPIVIRTGSLFFVRRANCFTPAAPPPPPQAAVTTDATASTRITPRRCLHIHIRASPFPSHPDNADRLDGGPPDRRGPSRHC